MYQAIRTNIRLVNSFNDYASLFTDTLSYAQRIEYLVYEICGKTNIDKDCIERFISEYIKINNSPAILAFNSRYIEQDSKYFYEEDISTFLKNAQNKKKTLYIEVNKVINFELDLYFVTLIDGKIPLHIRIKDTNIIEKYLRNYWKNNRVYLKSETIRFIDSHKDNWYSSLVPIKFTRRVIDVKKIQIEGITISFENLHTLAEETYDKIGIPISIAKIYPLFKTEELRKAFGDITIFHNIAETKKKFEKITYNIIQSVSFKEGFSQHKIQSIYELLEQAKNELGATDYYTNWFRSDNANAYLFIVRIFDIPQVSVQIPIYVQFFYTI